MLSLQLFSPGGAVRVSGNLSAWPSANTPQAADLISSAVGFGQSVCRVSRVRRVAGWDAGTLRDVLFLQQQRRRKLGRAACWCRLQGSWPFGTVPSTPKGRTHSVVHAIYRFLGVGSPTPQIGSRNSGHCRHVLYLSEDSESFYKSYMQDCMQVCMQVMDLSNRRW